jgi:hypothetical protein
MLPKNILDELKQKFKDNKLLSDMIANYFENGSEDLKPLIDSFVGGKLDEISKS